jgi:hypothetical protein
MSEETGDDYRVGYAKPPEHTRFKKGRSGNPNGRPKGAKNFAGELQQELAEPILVKEDGKSRRLSKRRAMIKRQVQKALQGDARALMSLLTLAREHEEKPWERDPGSPLGPADQAIIARFLGSNRQSQDDDGSTSAA